MDPIEAVDWIALASLRDSENDLFNYDQESDQFAGIALPGGLESWFKKSDLFRTLDRKTNIVFDKGLNDFLRAASAAQSGSKVCLFLGSKVFSLEHFPGKGKVPADHWAIMVEKENITIGGDSIPMVINKLNAEGEKHRDGLYDKRVRFSCQAWGIKAYSIDIARKPLALSAFLDFYYGFIIVR